MLPFAGPAVIASIAYMDPGNFATNIQAGARYGYTLLWVVLLANLIAMLFQALSAKLGIVTGRNLAEMCREQFPPPVVYRHVGRQRGGGDGDRPRGIPRRRDRPVAAVPHAAARRHGRHRDRDLRHPAVRAAAASARSKLIIGALVAIIGLCYLIEMFIAPVDWGAAALHSVLPQLPDAAALTLSVGIVGATVMPHAIYLHSGLTQGAGAGARRRRAAQRCVRFSNIEVLIALGVAGLVNMAMVMMASAAFHAGHSDVAEIETAYHTLTPLLGVGAAGVFLVSLMASGISSSAVGTMAGQMIMQGFVGFRIPIWLRRLVTMVPAFVVVGAGRERDQALVISQVVL